MLTDPIADYLTRVRNAVKASHRVVEIPGSNLKRAITKILFEKGYILNYKFEDDNKQGIIKIALKFHPDKNNGDIFFEGMFREVKDAYEVLSNPKLKPCFCKKL